MSTLTCPSPPASCHCSSELSEGSRGIWVKGSTTPKCPSPALCSRGSWCQQPTPHWKTTSTSKLQQQQPSQASSGAENSQSSPPSNLTPVSTSQGAVLSSGPHSQPPQTSS